MKRKVIITILLLVLAALVPVLWPETSSRQILPDGSELTLSGVRIGSSNVYTHGSRLSKLLGNLVPSNGMSVGKFKLRRAQLLRSLLMEGEVLTAELGISRDAQEKSLLFTPSSYRKRRLLIFGDDEAYVFVRRLSGFQPFDDGLFSPISADAFPRDSQRLHFRLEDRDSGESTDWRELATFVVKNPKPARIEPWTADRNPRFPLPDEFSMEVGELTVRPQPPHPEHAWEYIAELPLRITRHGQAVTNLGILSGRVRDSTGNSDRVPTRWTALTNDWMMYQLFQPLDATKLWKFQLRIGQDRDFSATNLFSFAVPYPFPTLVQTNLGGFPCRIDFAYPRILSVEPPGKPPGTRLSFVGAKNAEGASLSAGIGGSGEQHFIWRSLNVTQSTQVHVTVAIRPETEIEFTLQPKYERRPKPGRN